MVTLIQASGTTITLDVQQPHGVRVCVCVGVHVCVYVCEQCMVVCMGVALCGGCGCGCCVLFCWHCVHMYVCIY